MDKRIGIGLIVGLVVVVVTMINRSENFTSLQKTYLSILCVLFFPGGLLALLITYLYNKQKLNSAATHNGGPETMTKQHIRETENAPFDDDELEPTKPDSKDQEGEESNIENHQTDFSDHDYEKKLEILKKSHEQGLLTQQEFEDKSNEIYILIEQEESASKKELEQINEEEITQILVNRSKALIDQLDELLSSGLINQSDYEIKRETIISEARKKYETEIELRDPNKFKIDYNSKTRYYGYVDQNQELVIEHKFDDAYPFSEGLANVIVKDKSGYIDKSGCFVVSPIYDPLKCSFFKNGVATVAKNGREFKINTEGQEIK